MDISNCTQDSTIRLNLKMDNEKEQLLKLKDACEEIKLLLKDEKGNLYKLIKNKKNKFAKAELSQLYEKFNYCLAVVSKLNEECNLGYSPDEEYIKRKISAKNEHLSNCFDEYRLSMDSNYLCRMKAFWKLFWGGGGIWSGGVNLHIGIMVLNYDIAFTCSKMQYEITMIFQDGWDAPRCHKYDYHSNNKKLLLYRIDKLTALIKLQNMVYNDNRYSIDDEVIKQIKTKIS